MINARSHKGLQAGVRRELLVGRLLDHLRSARKLLFDPLEVRRLIPKGGVCGNTSDPFLRVQLWVGSIQGYNH